MLEKLEMLLMFEMKLLIKRLQHNQVFFLLLKFVRVYGGERQRASQRELYIPFLGWKKV